MAVAGVSVALEALPLVRVHDYDHHEDGHDDDYDYHHDNDHDNDHDDSDSVDDNHNYGGDNCVVLLPSNSTTTTKSAFLTLQVLVLVMAVRCSHHLVRLGLKTLERPGLLVAGMRATAMGGAVNTGAQNTDPVPVDVTMTTIGMRRGEVINMVMGLGLLSTERITGSRTITERGVVRVSADHREGNQSTLFTIPT